MNNEMFLMSGNRYLWSIPILFFIGSFFHFFYALTSYSPIVGAVAAVNESVWEHQKMVVLPVIGWWIICFFARGLNNQMIARKWFTGLLVSLIVSILTIPFTFYFYSEAFGAHLLIVDIFILFLAVTLGQCMGIHFYRHAKGIPVYASSIIILLILFMFIIFTFHTPALPWFRDSLTGQYGIQ